MNARYFACTDCQLYTDAGYRWCYWELEHPRVVRVGEPVDVNLVLAHAPYWNPPKESGSDWLHDEVLPTVRAFFARHGGHHVVYWDDSRLPENVFLDWLEIGRAPYPSPRYFVEVIGVSCWDDVLAWKAAQGCDQAGLWGSEGGREAFRRAVESRLDDRLGRL